MNPRVSVAQMDCKLGNVKHNLKTIHHLAEKAARSEPDILCFPELATTGYSLNARWRKFSENIPGPATERLAQIANEHGFYLVCGMSELDSHSKHIFNSSVLLSPNGRIVGVYRKVHLWDKERQYFTPGDSFRVFNTKIGKIGLGICYDLEFPESARAFAVQGANMVVYSSAEPHPFEDYVEIYLRSRAAENCLYICHSNRIGKEGKTWFFGQSKIVSPDRRIMKQLGRETGYATASLELDLIRKLRRKKLPYLKQRVPGAYSLLAK